MGRHRAQTPATSHRSAHPAGAWRRWASTAGAAGAVVAVVLVGTAAARTAPLGGERLATPPTAGPVGTTTSEAAPRPTGSTSRTTRTVVVTATAAGEGARATRSARVPQRRAVLPSTSQWVPTTAPTSTTPPRTTSAAPSTPRTTTRSTTAAPSTTRSTSAAPSTTARPTTQQPTTTQPSTTSPATTQRPTTSTSAPRTTTPAPSTTTPKSSTTTPRPSTTTPKPTTTAPAPAPSRTIHQGDLDITQDGTVIDNVEVRGRVHVRAANVTIKNSLIVGDGNPKYYGGMLTNYDGKPNLRVYNTTIHESSPSPYNTEGVVGFNFLLDGVTVIGQIDNVQIRGSNVTIRNSTLKDTRWYASHPNQGGGPTHSDNVQVLQGDNILIENNTITGSENFAVLGAPEQNTMRNLVVRNNYLAGGGWTAKFSTKGGFAQDVTLSGNRFGGGSKSGIDLIVVRGVNLTMGAGNVRTSGGTVPITWSSS